MRKRGNARALICGTTPAAIGAASRGRWCVRCAVRCGFAETHSLGHSRQPTINVGVGDYPVKNHFSVLAGVCLMVMATAQASAEPRLALGQGVATSCGTWTQARQARTVQAGLAAQWVAGWLSGRNNEDGTTDFLVGTDFDGLMAWIDNYCRSNPLDTVGTAALRLTTELLSRAR